MCLFQKIRYLVAIAKEKKYTKDDLEKIKTLALEVAEHPRLSWVFGYCVSDFAIATLKWIGEQDLYEQNMARLSDYDKDRVKRLLEQYENDILKYEWKKDV